ncbi:MAG: DUF421 domain-containing protein [Ruminiclostridium sp.]|nr:DUF421 domain-containing protein [Ruminiclostridium sp.]
MLIIMIRTVILYLVVIAMMRLMGKKQLGELQPGELVTTILISNIATMSIEDPTVPMLIGIAPILTIVCIDVFVSVLTLKLPRLRTVIAGHPKVIISDGVIDRRVLEELRYTIDDLLTAMRGENIFDINEVRWAIVETTGKISFCRKSDCPADPPAVVIRDGVTERSGMKQAGLDDETLRAVLRERGVTADGVFLLAASKDGTVTLIRKDEVKNG